MQPQGLAKQKPINKLLTQECRTNVLGDLIARAAGFREMAQLFV